MGGGDLNLKKSWHPNTMKNMERVWKAEQKDNEEKKRIAELQKELNAERDKEDMQKFAEDKGVVKKKDDVKLEWMYKGPSQSVNREEYLLGKSIDKTFEKYNNEQGGSSSAFQDEERIPGAVREAKSSMLNEQVDIARKLNEDPLVAIRQRAVEKAKQLYNNPVRMKEIQKLVASSSKDKKHKKDKKKKKSKKSSKKDEELDALLTEKLKNALKDRGMLRKLKKKAEKDSSDSSSGEDDDDNDDDENEEKGHGRRTSEYLKERDAPRGFNKRSHSPLESYDDGRRKYSNSSYDRRDARRHSRSPRPTSSKNFQEHSYRGRSRSKSRERERYFNQKHPPAKNYHSKESKTNGRCSPEDASGFQRRESLSDKRKLHKNISPASKDDEKAGKQGKDKMRYYSSSDSASDSDDNASSRKKRSFGLMMADGSKPVKKSNPIAHEVKPGPSQAKPVPWQRKERVKLSEEEKERRRQEMLANATWRDKEREENVRRYRVEEDRERKQLQEEFDDGFARKQFSKATEQSSIEGRIKSKLNTIQRSRVAMDQNFARR